MTVRQTIGMTIRAYREMHCYTRDELADKLADAGHQAVSAQVIARWERGDQTIPADSIVYLASVLECSSCTLLGNQESMRDEKRIVAEYNNLSPRERDIVHYLAYRWEGDIHCLLEFCLLYSILPYFLRQKIVRKGITIYEQARANGELETGASPCCVQMPSLLHGWDSLRRKARMKKCRT